MAPWMVNELDVERILVLDYGDFCHYSTLYDLIVISKCYYDDPEILEYLLEHERMHRFYHKNMGYKGVFQHIKHDWETRYHFMGRDYSNYKKIMELKKGKDGIRFKELGLALVYGLLTIPTLWFQIFASFRSFLEWLFDF
jgi:hypothetical protein